MSTRISSAGLLYVYLSAYPENGKLCLRQLDTYRCIGDELYYRIMDMAAHADEVERSVHIFAVVGPKDKTDAVISIFEDELKANFQRVLANKRIKTSTQKLDSLGNDFFRCVQEFYCAQGDHFPKSVSFNYGDAVVEGICCDNSFGGEVNPVIDAAISLWVERERPMLCGRQVMTRAFFMRDFTDRKVIASLPDEESGLWRLVFEGGSQLYLSEDMPG